MTIRDLKEVVNSIPNALDSEDVVVVIESKDDVSKINKVKSVDTKVIDSKQRVSHVLAIEI